MKLLSRIGQIALKATELIMGYGPLVKQAIPGTRDDRAIDLVADKLVELRDVIVQVEIFGQALGLAGADKLKAAGPAVAQVILSSSILAGRKIRDPELFKRGATKMSDGMADIMNSLDDKVETDDHA